MTDWQLLMYGEDVVWFAHMKEKQEPEGFYLGSDVDGEGDDGE